MLFIYVTCQYKCGQELDYGNWVRQIAYLGLHFNLAPFGALGQVSSHAIILPENLVGKMVHLIFHHFPDRLISQVDLGFLLFMWAPPSSKTINQGITFCLVIMWFAALMIFPAWCSPLPIKFGLPSEVYLLHRPFWRLWMAAFVHVVACNVVTFWF